MEVMAVPIRDPDDTCRVYVPRPRVFGEDAVNTCGLCLSLARKGNILEVARGVREVRNLTLQAKVAFGSRHGETPMAAFVR